MRERFLAGAMSGVLSDACACTRLAAAQGSALKSHYAGMLATFLCFPLDTLRTRVLAAGAGARLQPTLMKIVREEGVSGLYKYASSPPAKTAPPATSHKYCMACWAHCHATATFMNSHS